MGVYMFLLLGCSIILRIQILMSHLRHRKEMFSPLNRPHQVTDGLFWLTGCISNVHTLLSALLRSFDVTPRMSSCCVYWYSETCVKLGQSLQSLVDRGCINRTSISVFCVKSRILVCSAYLLCGQKVWCSYSETLIFNCVNILLWKNLLGVTFLHNDNIPTCICWLDRCRCRIRKSAAVRWDSWGRWVRDGSTASISQMWWVSKYRRGVNVCGTLVPHLPEVENSMI